MINNKKIAIYLLIILVILFSILLIWSLIKNNKTKEGYDNNSSTDFVVTLTTEDNVDINKIKDDTIIGNGIPSKLEYNITSISSSSKDDYSVVFKEHLPQQINLRSLNTINPDNEREKLTSFIMVSPETMSVFPSNFQLKIQNNIKNNKLHIDLWGDNQTNKTKPRPIGNANTIIDPVNFSSYISDDSSVFSYNKYKYILANCFKGNDKNCVINKLDIGNKIVNIIQSGDIFDNKGTKIGNVTKIGKQDNVSLETILLTIENTSDITGLLFYMGSPVSI
jgi:hypothetical protein